MTDAEPELGAVPAFGATRVLVIGTGALAVSYLPFWCAWLRQAYPNAEFRCVLTRSAQKLVSAQAISVLLGRAVQEDSWTPAENASGAPHVELAEWPDAVIVYPATLHFLSRLALGLADTPAMLALQCSRAPVGLAPALPPGSDRNPVVARHLKEIDDRPNMVVSPPVLGRSATSDELAALIPRPVPDLLALLEPMRARLKKEGRGEGGAP